MVGLEKIKKEGKEVYMFDFKYISKIELSILERKREEEMPSMIWERKSKHPIINELRFNYDFLCFDPFFVHDKTGAKLELRLYDQEKEIYLAFMDVPKKEEDVGIDMMRILTKIADRYKYAIKFEINPKMEITEERIQYIQKLFGFQQIIGNVYKRLHKRHMKQII